ncbi:MAG: hypothetical protein P8N52_02565 [Crocinitomicaceae bacterium]|nr:hypothetical protein [Crocinitomicaceae bacterium]MDG1777306.1 hypothetical protein [Crocinitomicaceae bacterium]
MKKEKMRAGIIDLLINKAAMKQDIADYSGEVFSSFKRILKDEIAEIEKSINDKRIRLRFEESGKHVFRLFVGSDVLIFQLHTNVFRLIDSDPLWQTEYLKSNGANGFFGMINIYNFLAESYEQNRYNDAGCLIGRVFMNHDHHFMLEGKGQLGTLFKDLENGYVSDGIIRQIIQTTIIHAIDFDLITPPYEMTKNVSLGQVQAISSDLQLSTGKSLGFKFSSEDQK